MLPHVREGDDGDVIGVVLTTDVGIEVLQESLEQGTCRRFSLAAISYFVPDHRRLRLGAWFGLLYGLLTIELITSTLQIGGHFFLHLDIEISHFPHK